MSICGVVFIPRQQRTVQVRFFLGILTALHPDIFDQPGEYEFFINLL